MVSPAASSSRNWSQVAHSGTSRELASSTLGAKLWVRNTPTGLPDWTSRVSSPPSRRRGATIRSKAAHSRAAPPGPPYTTRSSGRSATSGSRLLQSIRRAPSCCQPRQESLGPRGARTTLAPSMAIGSFPAGSPEGPGHLLGRRDQGAVGHQALEHGHVGRQVTVLVKGG